MQIQVEEHLFPQPNRFAADYSRLHDTALSFFHHHPFEQTSYEARYDELQERKFKRAALSAIIEQFMSRWSLSDAQSKQLERLQQEESVVVIGGQQAGLLTGPIYTLYKAITIIKLAQDQEEQLGIPVIPVFWIAGEDHDFQEINHVYVPRREGSGLEKIAIPEAHGDFRKSISHRRLSQKEIEGWLNKIYQFWPETEFSSQVQRMINSALAQSDTYVDFFAGLMQALFADYGLLMVDSADSALRQLEGDVFESIIKAYPHIDADVRQVKESLEKAGYPSQIELGEEAALLFIYEDGERLLLEQKDESFITKDGRYQYSLETLLQIARDEPWRLSHNVITRPLAQEMLFPTLAFVAGPGEVAYWALFGRYFERFELTLPIILPRFNITLVEPTISSTLSKHHLDVNIVTHQMEQFRKEWLAGQDQLNLDETFETVKSDIEAIYRPLLKKLESINQGLAELGEKNLGKVEEQVNYLYRRSMQAFEQQHDASLRQFDKLEQALAPDGKLQERYYDPFFFFNRHGLQLVQLLMEYPFQYNGKHKVVYLHAN